MSASTTKDGTKPSAITRLIVDGATQLGVVPAKYAHLLGLAPEHLHDDLYRTPASSAIHILELLTVNAPWAEVAQLLARRSRLGVLGIWDYLLTCAPTPLAGIRDAATHLAAVTDAGRGRRSGGGRTTGDHPSDDGGRRLL
ncbi:hypothetical protein ACIHFE_01615 [Streptomyces sp. NPDC052396]|uniref:hypothetical protein n=1 Tax=Streptomyces sp. NPDC052396 TaxID=3365689 RepID=UPI0037D7DF16